MANRLKIILLSIFLTVGLYFLEPALDVLFIVLGIESDKWASWLLNFLQNLKNSTWIMHLCFFLLGALFGVLISDTQARFEQKKRDLFRSLAPEITELKNEIWSKAKQKDGSYYFSMPERQLKSKLDALSLELNKAGVKTPNFEAVSGPFYSIHAEHFLMAVEPYAKYGQIEKASQEGMEKSEATLAASEKINQDISNNSVFKSSED